MFNVMKCFVHGNVEKDRKMELFYKSHVIFVILKSIYTSEGKMRGRMKWKVVFLTGAARMLVFPLRAVSSVVKQEKLPICPHPAYLRPGEWKHPSVSDKITARWAYSKDVNGPGSNSSQI